MGSAITWLMASILAHHPTDFLVGDWFDNPRNHPHRHARLPGCDFAHHIHVLYFCGSQYSLTLIVLFCSFGLYQNLGMALASRESASFLVDNNFRLAIVGFILYTSAFVAESLRSGINTVDFGQAEAARSLGLSFSDMFRKIVFPQAVRAAIVPLGNTLIALTKNTTIASTIGVAEASLLMKSTIENHANQLFIIFFVFALGFIILTLPMGLGLGKLSERMAVKK